MFTRRTSAQAVPICIRILTAPSTLYIKSSCRLNISWTSKLALLTIQFNSEKNINVHYKGHTRDNLPKEIRGRARWTKFGKRDWTYVMSTAGRRWKVFVLLYAVDPYVRDPIGITFWMEGTDGGTDWSHQSVPQSTGGALFGPSVHVVWQVEFQPEFQSPKGQVGTCI